MKNVWCADDRMSQVMEQLADHFSLFWVFLTELVKYCRKIVNKITNVL